LKLFAWMKSILARKPDNPVVGFVWLLVEPRSLDVPTIKRTAEQEWNIQFDNSTGASTRLVAGEAPLFTVKFDPFMFLVNCRPTPYVDNQERAASGISDLRVKNIIQYHRGWISVDLMGEYEAPHLDEGYRLAGRLAAGLANDDCLGLLVTESRRVSPYTSGLLNTLRGSDMIASLCHDVVTIFETMDDDPEMELAAEEARRSWPQFVQAFENPKPNQEHFAVKLPISDGDMIEFIWIKLRTIEGDILTGELANRPTFIPFMKFGDTIQGKLEDLNDWAYTDDGNRVGGFTTAVLSDK
jgi:uncharacterized protein YegJ (DUF2314 family)